MISLSADIPAELWQRPFDPARGRPTSGRWIAVKVPIPLGTWVSLKSVAPQALLQAIHVDVCAADGRAWPSVDVPWRLLRKDLSEGLPSVLPIYISCQHLPLSTTYIREAGRARQMRVLVIFTVGEHISASCTSPFCVRVNAAVHDLPVFKAVGRRDLPKTWDALEVRTETRHRDARYAVARALADHRDALAQFQAARDDPVAALLLGASVHQLIAANRAVAGTARSLRRLRSMRKASSASVEIPAHASVLASAGSQSSDATIKELRSTLKDVLRAALFAAPQ